jgi:hypothetical protein
MSILYEQFGYNNLFEIADEIYSSLGDDRFSNIFGQVYNLTKTPIIGITYAEPSQNMLKHILASLFLNTDVYINSFTRELESGKIVEGYLDQGEILGQTIGDEGGVAIVKNIADFFFCRLLPPLPCLITRLR